MDSTDSFLALKDKVLSKKPILREILAKHGSKSLFDYVKGYISVNLNPPIKSRQNELIGTIKEEVGKLLGKQAGQSVANQLKRYYYVSTADHHGPICHPFFLSSNLISAAPYFEQGDTVLNNVIVLSCGNVSLNNSSFPRGLIFNALGKNGLALHQLPFSSAQYRQCPVFNFPKYTEENITSTFKLLYEKVQSGELTQAVAEKAVGLLEEIYLKPDVLEANDYSEQITKTNFTLWQKFFNAMKIKHAPNLIYLEQESLVNRLLINHHLFEDTVISRMIFDPSFEKLILKYFDNIQGAFSVAEGWGTYFFWALPKGAKYRLQLFKQGNYLASADGSYKVALTPDGLYQALVKKELIPSMMMCYVLLTFYYGLKCLGGFSQVNYLTFMKKAYIKMQADRGKFKSIELCARVQTKEMGGDFTLAFLSGGQAGLVPATGLDLLLYGDEKTWPCLVNESKNITLEEAINPLLPEFYRIIYPENMRTPELMELSSQEISRLTYLEKKISPCVTL
ncbi:MAG: hypothetical protein WCV73_02590 [Patescibacteria group bacterium]|jgi:hypothetical protein